MGAAPLIFRFRARFSKAGALRYTGHLDLQRTFERMLRRARVPLAFTEGYHARPRLQFAHALPLGFTSSGELVDMWLERCEAPARLLERLRAAEPPGLSVSALWPVARVHKQALPTLTHAANYVVALPAPAPDLITRVPALVARDHIERTRRDKPYDLRPLIEALRLVVDAGGARLEMRLATREGATGRPEAVLAELGLDAAELTVHRAALVLDEGAAREERIAGAHA